MSHVHIFGVCSEFPKLCLFKYELPIGCWHVTAGLMRPKSQGHLESGPWKEKGLEMLCCSPLCMTYHEVSHLRP